MRLARILGPVTLKRAQVIRVSQLRAQLLKDLPISLLVLTANRPLEVTLQINYHPIVIQQRVIDVEEKYNPGLRQLLTLFERFSGMLRYQYHSSLAGALN